MSILRQCLRTESKHRRQFIVDMAYAMRLSHADNNDYQNAIKNLAPEEV